MNPKKVKDVLNAPGIGAETILNAAKKIAPKLVPFIAGASSAGYAADQVLDFLKNQFISPKEKRERASLTERVGSGVARPDEAANLSRMERKAAPFENAQQGIRMASQLAGGLASLGGQPQQQEEPKKQEAPPQLTQEEISQLPGQPKQLPARGLGQGLPVVNQRAQGMAAPQPQEQSRSFNPLAAIIGQFPQLGQFLDEQIKAGKEPREAAILAKKKRLLSPIVGKIEKDVGQAFEDMIATLFPPTKPSKASGQDPIEQALLGLISKLGK